MNLIANTGIQYVTVPLEINLDSDFKMSFYESDTDNNQLKLEIAHKFSDSGDEIWVKKLDLFLCGYLTDDGKVGRMENGKFKAYKWEEIKEDFKDEGHNTITPMEENEEGDKDCFQMTLNSCRWENFENRWLPCPFFKMKRNGKSDFGPINWCRCKFIPDTEATGNLKKYNLLLAFDTRSIYESEGYDDEDLQEMPVFVNENAKDFALCNNEFSLVDFCTKHIYKDNASNSTKEIDCDWVDETLLKYFHNCTKEEFKGKRLKRPKMSYMAQFIFINRYLQQLNVLPKITLFSDKNIEFGTVDLLVDMGNSRTCAILFDESEFKDVDMLNLQNFSNPFANGKLNRQCNSFDMRLAFREADFGGNLKKGSSQFTYPSMVSLGIEATELIYNAVSLNDGIEKITTFSSPKRFLWDNKPQHKEWKFVTDKPVRIKGISEQLNSDGSLKTKGIGGVDKFYSRKALMVFAFIEILAQAKMQINSYEFRTRRGKQSTPRTIGRIIITCPTAMSLVEQISLRRCAEDATIILDRFYKGTYNEELDEKEIRKNVQVIPSAKKLQNTEERNEWIYDEATCAQFVYLYAELINRYNNNCKEYFDFYGKVRKDLGDYNKKSLTIGSVDIGAGTTDVMIAAYKYDDAGKCRLTPMPLFWESFYIAGDDLLKNLVRKLVIEGEHGAIQNGLIAKGIGDIAKKILGFFAPDNAEQDVTRRQIRSEFNLQISVPVALHFLELLSENKVEKAALTFGDIFASNKPTERVLEYFQKYFGFDIKDLSWDYDKNIVSSIVESTFDDLVGKISAILSYYGCDIVLLCGRPTSLKPLSDLFLKYYAVSPNRLITLNDYRIGTWYPFHDGKGYFKDAKSIVAVGAMIGNYASTRGSLQKFSLDFSELIAKMLPTTEYFTKSEHEQPFLSPKTNSATIEATIEMRSPLQIWTRQLNSELYPTRPFYMLSYNREKIEASMIAKRGIPENNKQQIKEAVEKEIDRLANLAPFKFRIVRENYLEDKETLKIESVDDRNNENLPMAYFSLQVQSMSESENYWLDSGEFLNLNPQLKGKA
ncbi:MAG: virulence factor SrfB [Fibromonadales bacterium]|nr:virulence factor SrfB [Fibromonadales bacterium]